MKKLLLFFMIASFVALGVACSSDDSNDGGNKRLALSSDANYDGIYPGTKVVFAVMGEEEDGLVWINSGVSYYVDGTEVGDSYTFNELGEFKVVAKKKGYRESNTLIIKVIEQINKGKLVVSVVGGVTEIEYGGIANFEVKDEEGINITNATIVLSDDTYIGYIWAPSASGTYKIFAFKDEYERSEGLIVTVKERVNK
ncbi:hypothetical protein [Myroides sp. DW712]|uniref:hypothetical protein n=1 Tax=Myroides sp. DW712 TaxID=3389800 RepID=UPI00397BF6F7